MADVMRQAYRELNDEDKALIAEVKTSAADFYDIVDSFTPSRAGSIAKTKIEEACMWAIKHITA